MVINRSIIGIAFVFLVLSVVWIVMAAAPNILVTSPAANNTVITGTFEFVANVTDTVENISKVEFLYKNDTISWTPFYSNTTVVPNGTYIHRGSLVTTNLANGTYQLNVTATNVNSTSNTNSDTSIFFIVANTQIDTTPPASVTNQTVIGNGTTWLLINWTNPGDADFNHVSIYKNNIWIYNTTTNTEHSYNITGLSSGTSYDITLKPVDNAGNVNATGATIVASTDPNTPTGQVTLTFSNLQVAFSNVTTAGNTNVTTSSSPPAPPGSLFNVVGLYYTISSTAIFDNATIGLTFTGLVPPGYSSTDVNLYHYKISWGNVTINRDSVKVYGNVTSFSTVALGVPPKPQIIKDDPNKGRNVETTGRDKGTFAAHSDQTANITWQLDGTTVFDNGSMQAGSISTYSATSTPGPHNVTVIATNTTTGLSGSDYWNWTVRPQTYASGNRVWDGGKPDQYSLVYTWNPLSFYAFYYDLDTGVGNEALTITLRGYNDRFVADGALKYSTTPYSVSFEQTKWGQYDVIGFMADKYFAGYTDNTSSDITSDPISPLNNNQLHKILTDDNTKRTITTGSTLTLQEGYVIKIKDVDAGARIVLLSLLKDGGEIPDSITAVSQGGTFVYAPRRVGVVSDLPIIAVRIENVFSGRETSAAFTGGIFQISESFTSINSNNKYGMMEITTSSASRIEMENSNSFTLSQGSTIDIMGDLKFIVADNSTVRFAPMVKRSGSYEVRGTVAQNSDSSFDWTPMNFEGFYYNINDDVGTEKLSMSRSGTTINKRNLNYTTTPQAVSFNYDKFGTFKVIGFMADKYFAGYIGCQATTCITTKDIGTISNQQLHKVLVDDDTQRVIYAGSTLTLNDGYVLKIKDVNIGAGTAEVFLGLLKDGNEVDSGTVVEAGENYIYAPSKVGTVSNLPIIAVYIDKIFRGKEATAAFVRGVFQISESYTTVKQGDRFGIMEVSEVSDTKIQMDNPSSFTLSPASTFDVMGNIKFKVADSSDVRFYPFIMANGSALASNQLTIDAPATPMVRDSITISVSAGGGTPIDNAEVSFDGNVIGTTNSTGKVDYVLTRSGQHTITATKLGYEKAIKTIQVSEYRDIALKFELPAFLDQGIPAAIKVISNGTAISGANVTFDGKSIGLTGSDGILTYTFDVSGTHNLGASKAGYISVIREITVRMPFTEFKALDINFTPPVVFTNQKYFVWANISNVGTKNGTLPVGLVVNDTVVDTRNVTLAPGAKQEINFTRKMTLPAGNYSVEILGQKKIMEVKEEPFNIFLLAGIVTALGAGVIYLSTTVKGKATLDMLTAKFNELITKAKGK